jgi:hypothetical protein
MKYNCIGFRLLSEQKGHKKILTVTATMEWAKTELKLCRLNSTIEPFDSAICNGQFR